MTPGDYLRPFRLILFCLVFATASRALEVKSAPALYTGGFGNCLGGRSSFTVSTFDIAYDATGNKTVVFHFEGTSDIENESLMFHVSIDAYGKNRYSLTFDPCNFNITSLCPLRSTVPVTARAVLPVGNQPLGELASTAFTVPDFEGSAKLQLYANSSKTEIGCYQASLTNGETLSHPEIVAPILGVYTLVAMLASFFTAAYGVSVPHMRMHHAHSLPVSVVLETFQTIFFSGALSVDWPPLLTAWWSNFAWSAGLIYNADMFRSISAFAGTTGNTSEIGGSALLMASTRDVSGAHIFDASATQEALGFVPNGTRFNSSFLNDYAWSGTAVAPGVPLPGNWSGFPGTLSAVNVAIADAFMVGLVWLLIALALVLLAMGALKFSLEGLARSKRIQGDRLSCFRSHWIGYLGHALVRALLSSFFMLMTLAMLQFTIRISVGAVAVATVVFILAVIGLASLVATGCRARTRDVNLKVQSDSIVVYYKTVLRILPLVLTDWESTLREHELEVRPLCSIPFFRIRCQHTDPDRQNIHLDQSFVKRFGWLSARYRRTRWWYMAYYVAYLFCRAALIGGGWRNPHAQVYGLLAVDVLNFCISAILSPFEGARNTVMAVWVLGICKIITTAVSTAFLPESNLDRTRAAALGVVIIVFQGLTVAALLVLILLSTVSSWMSLTRNREEIDPDWLEPVRVRYFLKMEKKARDRRFDEETLDSPPPTPHFSVVEVRRKPKIEDEDEDQGGAAVGVVHEPEQNPDDSAGDDQPSMRGRARHSHASSVSHRLSTGSLPRAARPYRASWSSRDFGDASLSRPESVLSQRLSGITCIVTDCDASNASATPSVKPQSSMWSLNTPSASRASSPGPGRLSRESVRRPPTALPEAPEPQD
ncbi:uncharacterized protein B0T15DRAFT_490044 [Chaetomium strumarium]|uniref:ML-like domain-containing protein n=1 Tax=Chaetomium strumarium TaxID=1170767 RepID=A0AAJ0H416_9PEZI|nr:hypothetical protein B0T15DRAFT_490044 [Chaetomium strumarium]